MRYTKTGSNRRKPYRVWDRGEIDAMRDLYWSGNASMRELAILTDQSSFSDGYRIRRNTGWIAPMLIGTRSRFDALHDVELRRLERELRLEHLDGHEEL